MNRTKRQISRHILLASIFFTGIAYPFTGAAVSCTGNIFSFVSFSDDYMMGSGSGLDNQLFKKMFNLDPNIAMVIANGDETDIKTARETVDGTLNSHLDCGAPEFPFFSAMGNHNLDGDDSSLAWYVSTYANNWASNAAGSRLARQLPGLFNFQRGPLQVLTSSGTKNPVNGSIYSFDYKNSHFVVINSYEQGITQDDMAGVWDVNGAGVNNPANSQLDWLRADLQSTAQPLKFVFSHVGLVAPWYDLDQGLDWAGCGQWSEHQTYDQNDPVSPFHTAELARVLSDNSATAVYRGHDHCPSRTLVNVNNSKVFERDYLDTYNDQNKPYGTPSQWEGLMGPGKIWQVDDGSVYNNEGFFTLTKVTAATVTFETYRFDTASGPLTLWDSFTIPVSASSSDTTPPASPTGLSIL